MLWGLLIAVVLTAAVVLIATSMKPMKRPELLSWAVVVVGFIGLWIVGGRMSGHIETRSQLKAAMTEVGTAADGLLQEAGLRDAVRDFGLDRAAGDMANSYVLGFYTKRIWICVIAMVSIAAAMVLGFTLFMQGGRGGGRSTRSSGGDEGYSTRGRYEDF